MKCKKHKRELTRIEVKSGWGSSFIDVCPVCQAVANRILSKSEIDYSKYEGVEPAHAWQLPEFKAL